MASAGPGTTTVVSQTVAALGRLLVTHIIPLVNSPFRQYQALSLQWLKLT